MSSPHLTGWLSLVTKYGREQIVVVPGGGIFADQVRQAQNNWKYDDVTAHRMALRAMEQFGLLLQRLEPQLISASSKEEICRVLESDKVPVWFPFNMIANNEQIKASWDITSDSLSLWLAEHLNCCNLVLVKSTLPENKNLSARFLTGHGYLDKTFSKMFYRSVVRTFWLSHSEQEFFSYLLNQADDTLSVDTIKHCLSSHRIQ